MRREVVKSNVVPSVAVIPLFGRNDKSVRNDMVARVARLK